MISDWMDMLSDAVASRNISIGITVAAGLALVRLVQRYRWGRCPMPLEMQGKTVIITGANSGIGRETALGLAKSNARVILACRNPALAEDAVAYIRKHTSRGELIIQIVDLQSFASIRKFVKEFQMSNSKLDVLVNNAGVYGCPFALSEDGYETHFTVNHLGHFLLTNLLLDSLKRTNFSRVVIVSSAYYARGKIDFEDLNGEKAYDGQAAYCNSKLANILFGLELDRRLKGTGVSVYLVSPGIVFTNLGRHLNFPWWKKFLLLPFAFLFIRSASEGSQTVLFCAGADIKNASGSYYRNCKKTLLNEKVVDREDGKKLWDVSSSATKLV